MSFRQPLTTLTAPAVALVGDEFTQTLDAPGSTSVAPSASSTSSATPSAATARAPFPHSNDSGLR